MGADVTPRRLASLLSFYGGLCRKVLGDGRLFSGFVLAASLQALGHGAMAVVAGLLGRSVAMGAPLTFRAWGQPFGATTLALVGLLGACLKWAGATYGATAQSQLAQQAVMGVRRRVAAKLLSDGAVLSAGQLSARLAVGLREIELGARDGFLVALRATLQLFPLFAAIAWMSSRGTVVCMLIMAPLLALMSAGRRWWRARHAEGVALAEALHRELDELVVHMDLWRTYGAGDRVCGVLDDLGARAQQSARSADGGRALLSGANEVLGAAALFGAFVAIDQAAVSPSWGGELLALATVVFMSYRPLRDLGEAQSALDRGAVALRALDALAAPAAGEQVDLRHDDVAQRRDESHAAPRLAAPARRGEARTWPQRSLVVCNVAVDRPRRAGDDGGGVRVRTTFTAQWGRIVAITGPTGIGKTTLLRALLGLEAHMVGSIWYGDSNLTHAGVGPNERPFAWVPQDAPLLAGTLADNLLCSDRMGRDLPADVLALLGAEALVEQLGLECLGASGRAVSGGERKLIALARAVASRSPVLVLDEPTAGLDRAAERRVLDALTRLRGSRTIVLVSHQPEPLAVADTVIRMGAHDHADTPSSLVHAGRSSVGVLEGRDAL